jgi:SAM-dependent methyltransferase
VSQTLEFTGERFTPECVREIRYEHVHRYAFASGLVQGKRVLDAACGEGYGSALLAGAAAHVTGVDRSEEAVQHARQRYRAGNLAFRRADCLELPFENAEFDCVVSFETLEHLEDHDGLLAEFRRVLDPQGFLLLSSPDKAVYTDRLQNRNEFHVRELYREELEALLSRHFPARALWGQKLLFQSAIWPLEGGPGTVFEQEQDGAVSRGETPRHDAVYFLALCAAAPAFLPEVEYALSLFDDAEESVYAHYHHEIRKNMSAGERVAELEREVENLKKAIKEDGRSPAWWRRILGRP